MVQEIRTQNQIYKRKRGIILIENTILEKKHYLMQMLSNAELLKRNTELEVLQDELDSNRLDEVMTIWNYIFSNLIREGLIYDYIKNTDRSKDIVRLTIDSVQYDCPASVLQNIFKDEYSSLISDNDALETAKNVEIVEQNSDFYISKEEYESLQKTIKTLKDSLDNQTQRTNQLLKQKESEVNIEPSKDKTDNQEINTAQKDELKAKENISAPVKQLESINLTETPVINRPASNKKEEKFKSISTFIYDIYDLTILPPGASTGENIKVIIAPLEASTDDSHPEIMAMLINRMGYAEKFVSQGNISSLKIKFDENEYLLRGSFSDGKFISHIIPAGATMSMGYSINKNNVVERRSMYPENTNYGHLAFSAYGSFFHIIPTSLSNDANGVAPCLICAIDNNGEKNIFTTATKGFTTYLIDNKPYHILTYWQNDMLCAEVLPA